MRRRESMPAWLFVGVLLSSWASPWATAEVVTVNPDADGYARESDGDGFGDENTLYVGNDQGLYHAALKFDLPNIASNATIVSAELFLRYWDASGSGTHSRNVDAKASTQYWDEGNIAWNRLDTGTTYDTVFIDGNAFDWYSWDVTVLAKGWRSGSISNNGVILTPDGAYSDHLLHFRSRETNQDPYLRIEYNYGPTLNLSSPHHIAVRQGDQVTVAWSATDPDDVASISIAYDPDTDITPWDNGTHTWIQTGIAENDGADSINWNTAGVP